MDRNREAFLNRFQRWKSGEKVYDRGIIVPYEDKEYDYSRANQLGYTPDKTGHMPTRDYETGRYLKRPTHPTIMKSIVADLGEGYIPTYNKYDGQIYSHRFPDDLPKYKSGKLTGYEDGKEPEPVQAAKSAINFANLYYNSPGFNERFRNVTSDKIGFLNS